MESFYEKSNFLTNLVNGNTSPAIRKGDIVQVRSCIDRYGIDKVCSSYFLLCEALKFKHKEIAKLLLSQGARVNQDPSMKLGWQIRNNYNDFTPLHHAVHLSDKELVELLLEKGASINVKAGPRSSTPLFEAVKFRKREIVDVLIKHGADIGIPDNNNKTPVQIAAKQGNVFVMKMLVQHGADVRTAFYHALNGGKLDTVRFLLENGADINTRFVDGGTPLYIATEHCHRQLVDFLLTQGADINAQAQNGKSVLCAAVERACPITVNILLSHRPNKKKENQEAMRIALDLQKASKKGYFYGEIIESLISYGFHIQEEDADDNEILFDAIRSGYEKTVRELLRRGSNLRKLRNSILSDLLPLYPSTLSNNEKLVTVLIKYGADENSRAAMRRGSRRSVLSNMDLDMFELLMTDRDDVKNNPQLLRFAVWHSHLEIAEYLLRHGIDVNAQDTAGRAALHFCVLRRPNGLCPVVKRNRSSAKVHKELVKLLLAHGADPNVATTMGETSLHIAVQNNLMEIIELLVNPETVNVVDFDGTSALHHSVRRGNYEMSEFLLKKGAKVNARGKNGVSPLHVGCESGHLVIVQLLLEFGAEIDCMCEIGTPLHVACLEGRADVVKFLVESGADVNVTTKDAHTAFDKACRRLGVGHVYERTREFFLQHLAKMKSANLYLNEKNLSHLEGSCSLPRVSRPNLLYARDKLQSCLTKSKEEVAAMKCEKIEGSNFSYYDILVKSDESIVKLSANESLAQSVSTTDFDSKFPYYASFIKRRFQKGKWTRELREDCGQILLAIFRHVPYLCIEQIMSYLTVPDLRILAHGGQHSKLIILRS